MYSTCFQQEIGRNKEDSGEGGQDPDIDRSGYVHVQLNERTESMHSRTAGDGGGACVLHPAVHEPGNPLYQSGKADPGQNLAVLMGSTCCTYAANAAIDQPR